MSTKLERLMDMIDKILETKDDKCVVFSHFLSFINLISHILTKRNILHLTYDGTMSQKMRTGRIKEFSTDQQTRVLIVSIKCGGVGLNLTRANHVFVMEPWWNPSFEHQAMDRVYRIGQQKTTHIVKFITNDTVEEKIKIIQESKQQLTSYTINPLSQEKSNQLSYLSNIFK